MTIQNHRTSTGIAGLDQRLGGGLIPGSLTVVLGATGIGKTQVGIHFAHTGASQDERPGFFLDLASRGDSQNHSGYAVSIADWQLRNGSVSIDQVLDPQIECGNYLRLFESQATRITQRDMSFDDWHHWQAKINEKLRGAISFIYGNFVRGSRRIVLDGFEPADSPSHSVQFNLFEYLYHHAVREDSDWVARELLREKYRDNVERVDELSYDSAEVSCVALCTSKEQMLDDLISRPLDEGDVIANANTLILMGKTRYENKLGRAMFIAKHRGSKCSEEILPYQITDRGLQLL